MLQQFNMDEQKEIIRLTQYSSGAGCGCKISPAVLKEILMTSDELPADPKLLVGNDTNDDASVYDLEDGNCLISTTDFFMPVVDDPYTFGKIAATNALSDVYAMGGRPLTALAILGWPISKLPAPLAQQVLEGARFVCRVAGITLAGGHSIESAEPIFGLSVNGLVSKKNIKRNNTAQKGDLLFMTKPLGVGIVTTAAKRGLDKDDHLETCIRYMSTLNKIGESLGEMACIHAMTDITGFGLAGHLLEMCEGSGLSAEISFDKVAVMPFLKEYISQFIYPDMTMKNFSFYSSKLNELNAEQLITLCDPQTSGGLLIAVAPNAKDEFINHGRNFGLPENMLEPIGVFTELREKGIYVS
jgi:selenide,water dikinase